MRKWAYSDGRAGVENTLTADEPLCPVHGDGADHFLPEMLRHLEDEANVVVEHLERRQDRGQPLVEAHVHDGADDLAHLADGAGAGELIGDLAATGFLAGGRRRRSGRGLGRRGGGVGGCAVEYEARGGRAVVERRARARGR